MKSDADDDALSWDGDEDAAPARLPKGWKAVGKGSDRVEHEEAAPAEDSDAAASDPASEATGLGSGALLALGVLGGVYLLYTIGWIVGGLRLQPLAPLIVTEAMYIPWFVLAVAAPAVWFLTVWVCTRRSATWVRMTMLAAGAVLLVPWPFVTMGAVGA